MCIFALYSQEHRRNHDNGNVSFTNWIVRSLFSVFSIFQCNKCLLLQKPANMIFFYSIDKIDSTTRFQWSRWIVIIPIIFMSFISLIQICIQNYWFWRCHTPKKLNHKKYTCIYKRISNISCERCEECISVFVRARTHMNDSIPVSSNYRGKYSPFAKYTCEYFNLHFDSHSLLHNASMWCVCRLSGVS